jgi:hypothetical protein
MMRLSRSSFLLVALSAFLLFYFAPVAQAADRKFVRILSLIPLLVLQAVT